MGTTTDKLNKLIETKNAIRTSITNKGGELTESDKFGDYATAIDNIQTGGGVKDLLTIINGQNLFNGRTITDSQVEQILSYDATSNVTNMNHMFSDCEQLTTIPPLDTSKVTDMGYMFYQCSKLTTIPQLDTSNVTNMSNMFYSCINLTTIPQLDTSKVTDMGLMFYYCYNLKTIPPLDTSKVTNMGNMFYDCSSLTTIPPLDTSNVTNMTNMFCSCENLTAIPQLNTSNAAHMHGVFSGCKSLTAIPQLDTSKVTDMDSMFGGCENLTAIPQLDTSNATSMGYMFYHCKNLTAIPQLDTSNVTSMDSMFTNCEKLTTIPQLDTSKVTNMRYMFQGCYKVEKIDLTYMSTNYNDNFAYDCYSLKMLIIRNMPSIPSLNSYAFNGCYHFYGTTHPTYNPEGLKDGLIYVPDDKVESVKIATNWSVFADIITPLSLVGQPYIYDITSNNRHIINKSSLFAVRLLNFINTPEVIITSSNEEVATISNIVITTEKITFNADCLSAGTTTITVQFTGDTSAIKTIDINVIEIMEHRIEELDGVTYGFTLNSKDYYESTNKSISNSYSLCKLVFNATETNNILKLECINSGEKNYDFGILSNIDTPLSLDNNIDSTNVYKSFKGQSSTSPVTITYPEATVGEHYIYIKYRKDSGGDNGNDSLQFGVTA